MSKGYLAIIVSAPISDRLEKHFNHHVTILFGCHHDDALVREWEYREVWVMMEEEWFDKDVQAVSVIVPGVPIENANPHITISTAAGISPVKSNDLMKSASKVKGETIKQVIKGRVEFIPFK